LLARGTMYPHNAPATVALFPWKGKLENISAVRVCAIHVYDKLRAVKKERNCNDKKLVTI